MTSKAELKQTEQGLAAICGDMSLCADFARLLPRIRKANLQKEMIVKACKLTTGTKDIRILDATAGLGEDSFLMASAGALVTLYESDPVIGALLEDALLRALKRPETAAAAERMHLIRSDSVAAMKALSDIPDIIYLDPMFPARSKSGLVKKKAQILQMLEPPCSNEEELFLAAKGTGAERIVVKRPLKGPYLCGSKPSYSLNGSVVRYDCYLSV